MTDMTPERLPPILYMVAHDEWCSHDEPGDGIECDCHLSVIALLRKRLAEAEKRADHEAARLREAVCRCGRRPDPLDVPLDNDPQHHDFSCPYRTGAPGGLLDAALAPGEPKESGDQG